MTTNTNTERNELTRILWDPRGSWITNADRVQMMTKQTDAILAEGYRKPRTITTVEELDALPDEAVVRSEFGVINAKRVGFQSGRVFWACPGDSDEHTAGKITLPATVLHTPEPTS